MSYLNGCSFLYERYQVVILPAGSMVRGLQSSFYIAGMSRWYTLLKFSTHRLHARRWDSFHSPALFNLFACCCDDRKYDKVFAQIEAERVKMLGSKELIGRTDYGAGMHQKKTTGKTPLADIARHSLSLPFQCRFLFRLVKWMQSENCIEFGTSLGITASYLASASEKTKVITIEGDPQIAVLSQKLFDHLDIHNVRLYNSVFEDFIKNELPAIEKLDFIFLDGHHQSAPLIHYYHALRPHFNANTIVMIDDIYWSSDMYTGWESLKAMPEVTQSVDCFHFGLLFYTPQFMNKEHHKIRLPMASFIK